MENKKNGASTFFKVTSWILWIGGFLISVVSNSATLRNGYYSGFDIMIFLNQFISYIVYGCFCMCVAVFFDKLQDILNELRSINNKLPYEKTAQKNRDEQIFHD